MVIYYRVRVCLDWIGRIALALHSHTFVDVEYAYRYISTELWRMYCRRIMGGDTVSAAGGSGWVVPGDLQGDWRAGAWEIGVGSQWEAVAAVAGESGQARASVVHTAVVMPVASPGHQISFPPPPAAGPCSQRTLLFHTDDGLVLVLRHLG